jgi:protein tyrosine phosphatase (PTP) superfamily phosphohydrolase (DUF442 family)
MQRCWLLSLVASMCFSICAEDAPKTALRKPEPIKAPHLENAFKFTDKVWGGAEPHDEEGFQSLKALGVKTIISVDGAKPDVELARKYGLQYVHLPIGYDQVPSLKAKEIAKAINDHPGPVFVHCHHGRHRSPAALATACVINGSLTNEEAVLAMKAAGTGANYKGLWESARSAKQVDEKELVELKVAFVEQAPIPPMADAMVEIDKYFEHLKIFRKAGWLQPRSHPDLDPAHEALKLREMYTELMRTEDYKKEPADFKKLTEAAEADAKLLDEALRKWKTGKELAPPKEIDTLYQQIEQGCMECHAKYRNVPQRSK